MTKRRSDGSSCVNLPLWNKTPEKLLALVTEISSLLEAKERKLRVVRGAQPWNQPAESDKHQDGARQPYRSREHSTKSASQKQSQRSPSNEGDKEREPE